MFSKITPTHFVKRWISIDEILDENSERPSSLQEVLSTIENTNCAQDAALLIMAMRFVSAGVLQVYQGGAA